MKMHVLPLTTLKRWSCTLIVKLSLLFVLLSAISVVSVILQHYTDQVLMTTAYAEEKNTAKKSRKNKRTQAMNNKVYEKLQKAQLALEAKDQTRAKKILEGLLNGRKKLNDAELANVYNLYAFIYYSSGDNRKALSAYKNIITLAEAPEGALIQARYSAAQLYFVIDDYHNGVAMLLEWFQVTENPTASAYMLLAQGYNQLKKLDLALRNVEIAINLFKEKNKIPKENWYGLQQFLYYEKGNFLKVAAILKEMIQHYPKKQYWVQLSAMQAELKNESKQLSAMQAAYVQGLLNKEKELINIAYFILG